MLGIQKRFANAFFALISLPATAMGFALSVQISALSWILSTKYGFDIHHVGIVWAAGPIAGIIAQPLVGAISDNLWFWGGRRKPFIIIGGLLTAIMLLALPNLEIIQQALGLGHEALLGIAIAVALTLDLAINVSFNPTRSIIADVTDMAHRTKGYTWMQTISGTFGVLAYAIGAFLNNYILIYFGAFLALAFSLLPVFFIEEPRTLEHAEEAGDKPAAEVKSGSDTFVEILLTLKPLYGFLIYGLYVIVAHLLEYTPDHNYVEYACLAITLVLGAQVIINSARKESDLHEFQKILLAHAFTWWGVQTMFVYMFAYVKEVAMGFTPDQVLDAAQNDGIGRVISISFLILNVVGALLPAFFLQGLADKFGKVRVHTVSVFIMTLGYLGIYLFGTSEYAIYGLMAVVGIGWASVISLVFAIMSQRVNQSKMGLYMGIFNLAVVLPQLVASFKMGQVISETPDKSIVFIICAITLGVSSLLWLSVRENKTVPAAAKQTAGGGHH